MNILKKVSFPYKLSALVLLLYLLLVMALTTARTNLVSQSLQNRALTRMRTVVHFLAVASMGSVLDRQVATLQVLIADISRGRDIVLVSIVNPRGKIIAHSDPRQVGRPNGLRDDTAFSLARDTYTLSLPVTFSTHHLATVRVRFSTREVREAVATVRRENIITAVIAFLIGTFIITPLVFLLSTFRGRLKSVEAEWDRHRTAMEDVEKKLATLETEWSRSQKLIENVGHGIINLDRDNRITFINQIARDMAGLAEVEGKGLDFFKNFAESETIGIFLKRAIKGPPLIVESEIYRQKGSSTYLLVNVRAQFNEEGKYLGAVLTLMDITARKRQEEKINRRNRGLSLLYAVSSILSQCPEEENIMEYTLDKVLREMGGAAGWIFLVGGGSAGQESNFELAAVRGISFAGRNEDWKRDLGDFYGAAIGSGEIAIFEEGIPLNHPFRKVPLASVPEGMLLEIPLRSKGATLGILGIVKKEREELSYDDVQILRLVGEQVGAITEECLRRKLEGRL